MGQMRGETATMTRQKCHHGAEEVPQNCSKGETEESQMGGGGSE